jgi:hypothetical protein
MDADSRKQRASTVSAYIVGLSLIPIVAGSVLVNVPVIAVGALGVALAALVELRTEPKDQKPTSTPTDHPMRRAEDRKRERASV